MDVEKKKNRNGFLAVVKILFSVSIVLMHWNIPSDFSQYMFEGGYLYVDFFFIFQGYFIIKNWEDQNSYLVCKNYIENRYRRFFPTVIAAGIIMFILQLQSCITKIDIMKRIYEFVVQASFLSQIFAFLDLGVGGIFWFLSASIFGGALVLFVCKSFGKKAVPLLVVFFSIIYSYLYNLYGNIDVWHQFAFYGSVKLGIIRGMADIALGVIARLISDNYFKDKNIPKAFIWLLKLVDIAFVIMTLYLVLYHPHSKCDFYEIFIFVAIIIISDNYWKESKNVVINYLDQLCMPLYIFQVSCFLFMSLFVQQHTIVNGIVVVLLDVVISSAWLLVRKLITLRRNNVISGNK